MGNQGTILDDDVVWDSKMNAIRNILREANDGPQAPSAGTPPIMRLGQPVWYVERGGEAGRPTIVQSFVNVLRSDGSVGVIHKCEGKVYSDRAEAVEAWRSALTETAMYYAVLAEACCETDVSDAAVERMIATSLEYGATDDSLLARIFRHGEISGSPAVAVLTPRFLPGQVVWGICDGHTRATQFLLVRTTVKEVRLSRRKAEPDVLIYQYDSAYRFHDALVFADRSEAEAARLRLVFERIAVLEAIAAKPTEAVIT